MRKYRANVKAEVDNYSVVESKIAQHQAVIISSNKVKKFIIFSMRISDKEELKLIKDIFEIKSVLELS